ncbi:MAG: hypothetical protein IJU48_03430 [Synergistaceae bacterium]|nr:hypothetical protein [Synergistaceae bacterium]
MTTSTSLNAHEKVNKSNPRIEFRGKLDSLNARIILFQANSQDEEYISDLEEFREVVRKLQRCEACDEVFAERLTLWGLDEDEIHSRSHNPDRGHILPHYDMKREAAEINFLRTLTREAEILACKAFDDNDTLRIIHVLNRLSSALYVLIYKYLPEDFNRVMKFGRLS